MPNLAMNPIRGDFLKYVPSGGAIANTEVGTLRTTGGTTKVLLGMLLAARTVDPTIANASAAVVVSATGTITKDGATPVQAGALPGVYSVVALSAIACEVFTPAGAYEGRGTTAYSGTIKFALGGTVTAGDTFSFTVPAGDGKLVACQFTPQTDGTHRPIGFLNVDTDATTADQSVSYFARGPAAIALTGVQYDTSWSAQTAATKLARLNAAFNPVGIAFRVGA